MGFVCGSAGPDRLRGCGCCRCPSVSVGDRTENGCGAAHRESLNRTTILPSRNRRAKFVGAELVGTFAKYLAKSATTASSSLRTLQGRGRERITRGRVPLCLHLPAGVHLSRRGAEGTEFQLPPVALDLPVLSSGVPQPGDSGRRLARAMVDFPDRPHRWQTSR
jgi:hypothetical protein